MLDARALGHRLVGGVLHRDGVAAAGEGVGGDQHLGVAAGEARGHRLRAVAGEARRVDGADARHREHRDGRLLAHRQEHADGVAGAHAEARERVGQARDLARRARRRSACGRRRPRPRRSPRARRARPAARCTVDAVRGQVHAPAGEPARPLDAARRCRPPPGTAWTTASRGRARRRPSTTRGPRRSGAAGSSSVAMSCLAMKRAMRVRAAVSGSGRQTISFESIRAPLLCSRRIDSTIGNGGTSTPGRGARRNAARGDADRALATGANSPSTSRGA